jgi:hypothetical protein
MGMIVHLDHANVYLNPLFVVLLLRTLACTVLFVTPVSPVGRDCQQPPHRRLEMQVWWISCCVWVSAAPEECVLPATHPAHHRASQYQTISCLGAIPERRAHGAAGDVDGKFGTLTWVHFTSTTRAPSVITAIMLV